MKVPAPSVPQRQISEPGELFLYYTVNFLNVCFSVFDSHSRREGTMRANRDGQFTKVLKLSLSSKVSLHSACV